MCLSFDVKVLGSKLQWPSKCQHINKLREKEIHLCFLKSRIAYSVTFLSNISGVFTTCDMYLTGKTNFVYSGPIVCPLFFPDYDTNQTAGKNDFITSANTILKVTICDFQNAGLWLNI